MTITIVGLGPGDPGKLTCEAWDTLQRASVVLMWSEQHMPIASLPAGPDYQLLESRFAEVDGVDDVYTWVVKQVCSYDEVVYAVPGDPFVIELTDRIMACAAEQGKQVRAVSGISFIEPSLSALGVVSMSSLQVHNAAIVADMYYPPFTSDRPVLLAMVYDAEIAVKVGRVLLNQYQGNHHITLVHDAGSLQQRVETVTIGDFAEAKNISPRMTVYIPPVSTIESFASLQETMARLRAPDGCPWDREQTHETLRPYLIEEAYEVLDAIDAGDTAELCEELGDLLLQVAFHAQIAIEDGEFLMGDIINAINSKMHRRHPHVWGDVDVAGSSDVTRNWEAIKREERKHKDNGKESLLDGISKSLPALSRAYQYQTRAARVGFDWPEIAPVLDKIDEEIAEIRAAANPEEQAAEIGDLLFALVNWIRWMKVEPETALREANQRFYQRFTYIEKTADKAGTLLSEMSLEELDALWDAAKQNVL